MLPKSRRLTRQQFWQVSKQGFTIHDSRFTIKYLSNDVGNSRWAVVTSAKLDKRATVRNKLRRKIYKLLNIGHWTLNVDGIIFPKSSMLNLSDAKFNTSLNSVLSKISERLARSPSV